MVEIETAGIVGGRRVERALLRNRRGSEVRVLSYGATLESVRMPGPDGRPVDLVLGFDRVEDYAREAGYLGATVGRFANRIAGGRFVLDGKVHELERNEADRTHLHGGTGAFAHRIWSITAEPTDGAVRLALVSPDGDNAYPGRLEASCRYALDDSDLLRIELEARADAPTPVNLVNHTYWNLAGSGTIDAQVLQVFADWVLEFDAATLPTGRILEVAGTPLDFRDPRRLDAFGPPRIDACFLVRGEGLRPVAMLEDPASGRRLELASNQPGVQVYTAFKLDVPGREGRRYGPRSGICLETEALPDAPNQPHFPSAILRPGEVYRHVMECRLHRR